MKKKKITMRPLRLGDVSDIMTWVNDPEVVKNLQHFDKKFTAAHERAWTRKMLASKNDFVFSVFDARGRYVGQCGIHQISWENRLGRFSLIIKKEEWGKGYAQETVKLLLDHAFSRLNLNKVWLVVWATNQKNLHLYKKLGFRTEGVLKDEYFWRGRYHDMLRMRMLASEFRKKR